jgi:threonylcarbamoyladenosine tRNA methylthiotransferase MtaB
MGDQVPVQIARERNRVLRELAARKKHDFQEQFVNGELQAITLTHQQDGRTEALTDNYQKLWIEGSHQANRLVNARINGIEGETLLGSL